MVCKKILCGDCEAANAKGEDDKPSSSNATKGPPTCDDVANLPTVDHHQNKVVYTLVNIRHVHTAVDATPSLDLNQLNKQSTPSHSMSRAVPTETPYVDASTQTKDIRSKEYVSKGSQTEPLDEEEGMFTETSFEAMPHESGDHDGWSAKEEILDDADPDDITGVFEKYIRISNRLGDDHVSRLMSTDVEPTTDDERFITDMRDRIAADVI
ncbi:hypothetical protein PG984_011989 [Apiospora sp. TS-2023a]